MKINAIIESRDGGTLVLDFPRSIYDVYEKLQSVGIRQSPHKITLSDEDGDDVRVKLYSEDEIGKHLLLTLNEQNSLADANMLAFMVDNLQSHPCSFCRPILWPSPRHGYSKSLFRSHCVDYRY